MRHLLRNSIFAVGLIILLASSIYPPDKNLRLGKDLAGGVSLTYGVQMAPSDDPQEVLSRTIETLKRRVDPNGQLDIAMVAQGRDRIEITMPLPSERVADLRRAFEDELSFLPATSFTADDFDRIMRLSNEIGSSDVEGVSARYDAMASIATTEELLERFQQAATVFDNVQGVRSSLVQAQRDEAPAGVIGSLTNQAADLEIQYETLREAAVQSVISAEDVRRILNLSPESVSKIDDATGEPYQLGSPRDRAWDQLTADNPDLTADFQRIREAWQAYESERRSLDDPNDLIRLLSGAGVLSFRISVDPGVHPEEQRLREELRELGPRNARAVDAGWYRLDKIENWFQTKQEFELIESNASAFFAATRNYVVEEYEGQYFMLLWDRRGYRLTQAEGDWGVARAFQGVDQLGRPAISFVMDARGAPKLGTLTEAHVNDSMAVLLDDRVYTAPNLLSRISSQGQITGDFSEAERAYIINVLSAGSLQARLSPEPIQNSTVGPELGLDNLMSGLKAGYWALGAVSVFMVLYYFLAGGVAVLTLICSAIVILGMMSLNRAAFTLPGIAGVVLTFGMAVDANVLIYERIREELRKGLELKPAVRLGFQKALSSIVDGNVTNLIVCFVLAYTGTQEIRGFAITLGIGVVATLFSALFVARIVFSILVDVIGIKDIQMLPRAVPIIDRVLEPKIDWMKLRYVFVVISVIFVSIGIGMIASRGEKMLDNEFVGGTQVTLTFEDPETGVAVLTDRQTVEDRVHAIGEPLEEGNPLRPLRDADVLVLGPQPDGVTSDTFTIKTTSQAQDEVMAALLGEFQDQLSTLAPLKFAGIDETETINAPVYPIITGQLGNDTDRADYVNELPEWVGGVAILMEDITPPASLQDLQARLDSMIEQPDVQDIANRKREIILLSGTDQAVTAAAVVALDEAASYFQDIGRFNEEVAAPEWDLVRQAMDRITTPASVQTFSPAIAATFKAQAIVAVSISFLGILIYIWVRFGSVRYSLAAIVTLCHDVMIAIGLIALAEIVYDFEATRNVAQQIGILPFKIDLSLVAAILTIIGYSLNDTIIIMDRIRENRGKLDYTPRSVINSAINQTISRTVITSGTTFIATMILFIFGGEGVRAFSYALLIGIVIGTYSSIAVAAPLCWSRKQDRSKSPEPAPGAATEPVPST